MSFRSKMRLVSLPLTVVSSYLSAEMGYFIMDQYTFYKYTQLAGLPYGHKLSSNSCQNESLAPGNESSLNDWAQGHTARLNSLTSFLAIGIGILTNLVIGHLSDRFGRRPALLVVLFGILVQMGLSAIIVSLDASPWWRLLPSVVEGLLGGGLLSATAQFSALLVDLEQQHSSKSSTPQASHSEGRLMRYWLRLTYLEGFISLCLSGGSALGGALVYRLGFPLSAAITLIFFAPTLFFFWWLPFSTTPRVGQYNGHSLPVPDQPLNIAGQHQSKAVLVCGRWFCAAIKFLSTGHPLSNFSIAILFPIALAYMLEYSFLFLYLMSPPFCWNAESVGLWNGLMGAASTIIAALVIFLVYWCTKRPSAAVPAEATTNNDQQLLTQTTNKATINHTLLFCFLRFSLLFLLASRLVLGTAYLLPQPEADGLIYLSLVLRLPKSMIFPALRTIVASVCLHGAQGRTFAALGFWQRLGMLISMSVLPNIYAATLMTLKATAFVVCASLLAIALLLTVCLDKVLHQATSARKHEGKHFVTMLETGPPLPASSAHLEGDRSTAEDLH